MAEVASLIAQAVRDGEGTASAEVRASVEKLVSQHPAYPRPA
jgi:glycine/serine hydroxymethyltransferase